MNNHSLAFLKRLLDTPGPSGFEVAPARVWRAEAETLADQVETDVAGNSRAILGPDKTPRVMLAGHIDEIGLMVVHVDDDGFLTFQPIGGWDRQVLPGQRVVIQGKDGPVLGVIGRKAIHLMEAEERDKVAKIKDLWIDIGATDRADALRKVRVGDPAVIHGTALDFPNGRLVSRSIDNRIGAFVVLEALRLLAADRPKAGIWAVATVQEEIAWAGGGARVGATDITPSVALVVDVTHATDAPGLEKKEIGEAKLGGGPVLARGSAINPVVLDLLVATADAEGIPYTLQAAPRDTGTDADAIWNSHRGVATGLVSVPNRYMHSPNEMVALSDLEAAAKLMAAFCRRVTAESDFTPR
jgi:endoglucanase